MIGKRNFSVGHGRTLLAIGALIAGGMTGLVVLEYGMVPAPVQLPGRVVVARAGQAGVPVPLAARARSAQDGEPPEPKEPIQIVSPHRAVIVLPATQLAHAAGDH